MLLLKEICNNNLILKGPPVSRMIKHSPAAFQVLQDELHSCTQYKLYTYSISSLYTYGVKHDLVNKLDY